MFSYFDHLECSACFATYASTALMNLCTCGAPLLARYRLEEAAAALDRDQLEGQTLCLWRQGSTRMTSRWDPSRFTCVFAVQAAWRWLACYEIWHETGEWPLPEAK